MGGEKRFDISEKYLAYFVAHFPEMYYKRCLTYTIHCVLHIVDDARRFGSLETISNYKFENFLGSMKHTVKKSTKILEQISNNHKLNKYDVKPKSFDEIKLSTNQKDKFVILKDRTILEISAVDEKAGRFSGLEYETKSDFFTNPCSSSKVLAIYQVPKAQKLKKISFGSDQIMYKLVAFPYKDCYVMLPLIHTM
jgi:hypothetical protein